MTDIEIYNKCKELVESYKDRFNNEEDMIDVIQCTFLDCWSYQEKHEITDSIIKHFVKRSMTPPVIEKLNLEDLEGLISI